MYTLGTDVEVITDHKPLIPIYNANSPPRQLRVDRHRTKLLPYNYSVSYEPGKDSPCDYGSRHPPTHDLTQDLIDEWGVETGTDIYVNRVIEDSLPPAVSLEEIRTATKEDAVLSTLISTIGQRYCPNNPILSSYKHVFNELTVIDGVVMREHKIVIPQILQERVIEGAHEGHQHNIKTLQLLRETSWFPKMRSMIDDYVGSCISCAASSHHNPPVPLEPNLLPEGPWLNLHADFKGPIAGKYYIHAVIDQYSKYPEADIVTSTSFKKLRPVLDRIFATHGVPETMSTDNGSPYFSDDLEAYAKHMNFQLTPVTPDDPQGNGFAENFVKSICKLIHTSVAENKNPKEELYNFLLQYRATPHSTTDRTPAELLFNRKIKTKLPILKPKTKDSPEVAKLRKHHDGKKMQQKKYFDKKNKAWPKKISPGDQVLVKQKKTTTSPPYNPKPFKVEEVRGNQLSLSNGEQKRVRDKNKVKALKKSRYNFRRSKESRKNQTKNSTEESDVDLEIEVTVEKPDQLEITPAAPQIENEINDEPSHTGVERNDDINTEDEMNNHLEELLRAAEDRIAKSKAAIMPPNNNEEEKQNNHHRVVTRSCGVKLAWNPTMGSSKVLQPEAQ